MSIEPTSTANQSLLLSQNLTQQNESDPTMKVVNRTIYRSPEMEALFDKACENHHKPGWTLYPLVIIPVLAVIYIAAAILFPLKGRDL